MIDTLKQVREALHNSLYATCGEGMDLTPLEKSHAAGKDAITKLDALIAAQEKAEPVLPPFVTERKAAMAVYTPPFKYLHGYIYDSQALMVADNDGVEGAVASRVRGWGHIGHFPNGAELQDEIGQMMADALNDLYAAPRQPLTEWDIDAIRVNTGEEIVDYAWAREFARAIEAAHGIGGKL